MHPGSPHRLYRTIGPNGPGVYPQCVPAGGAPPHLLSWTPALPAPIEQPEPGLLSESEAEVLADAAEGLTVKESARSRHKGSETVKSQRRSVLLKLGARNMAQAVAMTTSSAGGRDFQLESAHAA